MTGLTLALAQYVANPAFGNEEEAACAVAKTGFIDTTGTMFAGCDEPVVRIMTQHTASAGSATEAPVPFAGLMLTSAQAACINAVASHALDYDDVALSAHTSTVLVPAILAEGHLLGISGREALRAYVVGYEVWAELFTRESDQYHLKGWHPTGIFGAVAAAAAIAYLRRLPVEQARGALTLAASMASGLVSNFGTMAKPMHAGRAAACAIEAVRLTMLGLTSAPDVFEHPAGYLTAISPAGRVDRTRPATGLGGKPRLLEFGLSIKQYPVCYSGHRIIDGALAITTQHNLQPADIRRVQLTIGIAQASMLRNHRPVTGLEAKFSAEFDIAAAIAVRQVGLAQLSDAFVARDDLRGLMEKIDIGTTDKICPIDPAFGLSDRVVIETIDGRVFDSGEIRFALGNAMNPLGAADLRAKFLDCVATGERATAGRVTPVCAGLYERLANLENLASVRDLYGTM